MAWRSTLSVEPSCSNVAPEYSRPSHFDKEQARLTEWCAQLWQASFAMSLNLLGINLMPLATAGLGSGVVLGFASQSVLANVIAGCNLVCPASPRMHTRT